MRAGGQNASRERGGGERRWGGSVGPSAMTPSGSKSDDDTVRRVLELARSFLGMEVAWLAQLHGGQQMITHVDAAGPARLPQPGSVHDLADAYCVRVPDGPLPRVVPDSSVD